MKSSKSWTWIIPSNIDKKTAKALFEVLNVEEDGTSKIGKIHLKKGDRFGMMEDIPNNT